MAIGGTNGPTGGPDPLFRYEAAWLRWLGYVRRRDLLVGGVALFAVVATVVALLPENRSSAWLVATLLLFALELAVLGIILCFARRVDLSSGSGLYVAVHRGSGDRRHGKTPEEALSNLAVVIECRAAEARSRHRDEAGSDSR